MKLSFILLENPVKIAAVMRILEQAITAGRLSANFSPHLSEIANRLMLADPTVVKRSAEWLARLVIRGVIGVPGISDPSTTPTILLDSDQDIGRIRNALAAFERAKPRLDPNQRDINSYQNLEVLEQTLRQSVELGKVRSSASFVRQAEGANIIYDDGSYVVYFFKGSQGDQQGCAPFEERLQGLGKLGMGPPVTSWCTRTGYGGAENRFGLNYLSIGDIYTIYKDGKPFAQALTNDPTRAIVRHFANTGEINPLLMDESAEEQSNVKDMYIFFNQFNDIGNRRIDLSTIPMPVMSSIFNNLKKYSPKLQDVVSKLKEAEAKSKEHRKTAAGQYQTSQEITLPESISGVVRQRVERAVALLGGTKRSTNTLARSVTYTQGDPTPYGYGWVEGQAGADIGSRRGVRIQTAYDPRTRSFNSRPATDADFTSESFVITKRGNVIMGDIKIELPERETTDESHARRQALIDMGFPVDVSRDAHRRTKPYIVINNPKRIWEDSETESANMSRDYNKMITIQMGNAYIVDGDKIRTIKVSDFPSGY